MKYLIFFTIIFSCSNATAQNNKPEKFAGVYEGHDYYSEDYGYYVFKQDSTFIFIGKFNADSAIKKIGKGTWNYTKKKLTLNFNNINEDVLLEGHINYLAETGKPLDSITLEVRLIDRFNKPIPYASIIVPELNKAGVSDSAGFFKYSFSLKSNIKIIKIAKLNFHPKEILLLPNFNIHKMDVVLYEEGNSIYNVIENRKETHEFVNQKNNFYIFKGGFVLKVHDDNNITSIVRLLQRNIIMQPLNGALFSSLIKDITK